MHCWFIVLSCTRTMDNSRICQWLLFHEHGKQNLCSHFPGQGSYYGYTHTWTKLHNEVMSWILALMNVIMHGPYLKQTQLLLCVIWQYRLWAVCPCLSWSPVALSRSISVEVDSERFSTCENLKCTYPLVQFIFLVYGHTYVGRHTYTCVLQCVVSLVWQPGLAQACPNH